MTVKTPLRNNTNKTEEGKIKKGGRRENDIDIESL